MGYSKPIDYKVKTNLMTIPLSTKDSLLGNKLVLKKVNKDYYLFLERKTKGLINKYIPNLGLKINSPIPANSIIFNKNTKYYLRDFISNPHILAILEAQPAKPD